MIGKSCELWEQRQEEEAEESGATSKNLITHYRAEYYSGTRILYQKQKSAL